MGATAKSQGSGFCGGKGPSLSNSGPATGTGNAKNERSKGCPNRGSPCMTRMWYQHGLFKIPRSVPSGRRDSESAHSPPKHSSIPIDDSQPKRDVLSRERTPPELPHPESLSPSHNTSIACPSPPLPSPPLPPFPPSNPPHNPPGGAFRDMASW